METGWWDNSTGVWRQVGGIIVQGCGDRLVEIIVQGCGDRLVG